MNSLISQQNISVTPQERRFAAAEERLFTEAGVDVRSGFLDGGGRRIHVLETGEGRPLLMIHGGNSVAAAWTPLWAELGGRHRIVAPDRPGCGLTHRQDYRGVDFRAHAIEFVGRVMDGAGLERATVVGNSMGGYWALLYALAHPERVERLVLLGEPAGSTPRLGVRHRLGATPLLNRVLFATVARPRPTRRIFAGLMADPSRASEALIACAYAGSRLPGAALAWRSMLELAAAPWRPPQLTHALRAELRELRVPVLLAWGDHDFAPVDAGREIARHVPGARFEVVRDAGHLVWLDQPAVAARLIAQLTG
jgi:pimeloyl-ACP methyl ester carboxylesterase